MNCRNNDFSKYKFKRYNETPRTIFFEFENKLRKCFQNIYEKVFKNQIFKN